MSATMLVGIAAVGVVAGFGLSWVWIHFSDRSIRRHAEREAQILLNEAKEEANSYTEDAQLAAKEAEEEVYERHEKDLRKLTDRVEVLDDQLRKRRSQIDREFNVDQTEIQKTLQGIEAREQKYRQREKRYLDRKAEVAKLRGDIRAALAAKSGGVSDDFTAQVAQDVDNQFRLDARRKAGEYEEAVRADAESLAKRAIDLAIARFQRPAPIERGVGVVEIPNPDVKARMIGPEGRNIAKIQEICGVELTITEKNTFQVGSFDPFKREVTTRLLERLLHERSPTPEIVTRLYEKIRGDVSRKIEADGNRVAAELGQRDLHPEIKRMLGLLRYRYSFAQNQHFHVAEVGWLCGLLSSELGLHTGSGKRSGLLHDVGKAMDHEKEGGHAVIGADFIQERNEKPEIVHAVRSHHFEEQPSSDLAFLVIAADAISGARPGARRQTVSLYNQKIETLSQIADSFPGVMRSLILNAGREVRVIVDSKRVDDSSSLKMAGEIAQRIEHECTYPGSIKVVVIRETQIEAMAR